MKEPALVRHRSLRAWFLCAGLLATGCASAPVHREPAVFFPPAPELPRLQFLFSFSSSKDIETQSAFDKFVVGERQERKLNKPYGIAIRDGRIYLCDTNAGVFVIDLAAHTFEPLAGAVGPGKVTQPINVSIDTDGTKYVTDAARNQVVVFDGNDAYVRAIGVSGEWRPVDAVAFEDRLYVADAAGAAVKVFDKKTGELVKTIGNSGKTEEQIGQPTNLAFDKDGNLFVSDFVRFQVLEFDRDGHFKKAIGALGDNYGHFARPKGVAVDREGRVYAVDAAFNNAQIFNRDGRLLMFFGEGGDRPGGLVLPAKVAIDYDDLALFRSRYAPDFEPRYLVFVTAQFGARMVNVYAYGQQKGARYPTDDELLQQLDERARRELEKTQPAPEKPPGG